MLLAFFMSLICPCLGGTGLEFRGRRTSQDVWPWYDEYEDQYAWNGRESHHKLKSGNVYCPERIFFYECFGLMFKKSCYSHYDCKYFCCEYGCKNFCSEDY
ncbi:uncharacterized protein LOC135392795 isoform X1 [Ornithodoros turicata]|uniref:uncharacterized protein LOC135392795 isoform X1 n=1 Tax=Ornithodoros turicata TaxID=34597 RepID=UPI003139BCC3